MPMEVFQRHGNLLQGSEAKKIVKNYNKIAKVLLEFEMLYHRGWLRQVYKIIFNNSKFCFLHFYFFFCWSDFVNPLLTQVRFCFHAGPHIHVNIYLLFSYILEPCIQYIPVCLASSVDFVLFQRQFSLKWCVKYSFFYSQVNWNMSWGDRKSDNHWKTKGKTKWGRPRAKYVSKLIKWHRKKSDWFDWKFKSHAKQRSLIIRTNCHSIRWWGLWKWTRVLVPGHSSVS